MSELNVISDSGTHKIESAGSLYVEPIYVKYLVESKVVTINNVVSPDFNGVYFAGKNQTINLSMKLTGGSDITLTSPPYPPFLMLPFIKIGGTDTIIDEVYFKTLIENGLVVIEGDFPSAGNWQLTQDRVNASLAEIYVDWRIVSPTISFRVA